MTTQTVWVLLHMNYNYKDGDEATADAFDSEEKAINAMKEDYAEAEKQYKSMDFYDDDFGWLGETSAQSGCCDAFDRWSVVACPVQ